MKNSAPQESSEDTKNTFWKACPRQLSYFPDTPCALGTASAENKDSEGGCPWYINSAEDNYCFWAWVRRLSDKDGFMEPRLQHEIATLLNTSGTKIHAAYKEAWEKMKDLPEYEFLEELFED